MLFRSKLYVMKKLPILFFAIVLLSSCSSVYLDQPIPSDSSELSEIPTKYRGDFTFEEGEEKVTVDENSIVYSFSVDKKLHKDSVPEDFQFINKSGKTYLIQESKFPKELTAYNEEQDSVYYVYESTLEWKLNFNLIAKPVGENLILNLILPEEENINVWWEACHLIAENETIRFSFMHKHDNEDALILCEDDLLVKTKKGNYYQSKWNEAKVLELIKQGAFGKQDEYTTLLRN